MQDGNGVGMVRRGGGFGGGGMLGRLKLLKGLMSGDLASMGAQAGSILKTKKSGFMEKKDRNKKKKRR